MRLVGQSATQVDVIEVEVTNGIFRRQVAITDGGAIARLKRVELQECRVNSTTCCMSSKRWALSVRRGSKILSSYEVRSGVVFDGAKPIGCMPDGASSLIADQLSAVEQVRVNPVEEIAVLA